MQVLNPAVRGAMVLAAAALLVVSFGRLRASGEEPATPSQPAAASPTSQQLAELRRALSGAALVGRFTVTGGADAGKLSDERYELGEVKQLTGELWLIPARIKYGEHDVTVPLTLPIRWAGDTPMICLDEMPIPGFGTFTARVMIYRDHYAGFWAGADHGGHLFGVIERNDQDDVDRPPAKVPDR